MFYYVLFFVVIVLPMLIELGVYYTGIWWHSEGPKDTRNGL